MNKRYRSFSFVFLIGILFVLLNNGCGTIWSIHSHEKTESLLYSGFRTDIDIIADPPIIPPMPLGGYILFCFDVPFSLVADTLLLPYTLVQHFTREEKEENILGSENFSEKED